MRKRFGYTLTELLVVLAIIALLAAILMPVFRAARASARQTNCVSNFHQAAMASQLYLTDYEDRFMPVNHQPGTLGSARTDRTWVQLVLPYLKSFTLFRCPSDTTRHTPGEGIFDSDLVPGDADARYFSASMRSNLGYNHLYLSPVVQMGGRWNAMPRTTSMAEDPSRTLLFVDSVWEVSAEGIPSGGGRWLVTPPCRYESRDGHLVDSFLNGLAEGTVYIPEGGWSLSAGRSRYGGAWGWHTGRATAVRLDGSVKPLTMNQLASGCAVKAKWTGRIIDSDLYLWDLR